jgi:hypothetical protein
MKPYSYLLTIGLVLAVTAACWAGSRFKLEQDTGNGYEYIITVTAFSTNQTLFDFYSSDPDGAADFEGETGKITNGDLEYNRSHIFLVDSKPDGLGLVVVHNRDADGNNSTSAGEAEMAMVFTSPDGASIARKDDDRSDPDSSSHYTWDYIAVTSSIYAQWAWGTGRTDGIAVAWSPGAGDAATIRFADLDSDSEVPTDPSGPTQTYQTSEKLTSWAFYDPNTIATDGQILTLGSNQPIRLTMLPLPPAAWPAVAVLGIIGLKKWRSRRRNQSEELS